MAKIPELDELVRAVDRRSDAPDDRLRMAVKMAAELSSIGEDLVGHYVSEAKDGGMSWADIGACLGVTKQAAQQRFVEPAEAFTLSDIKRIGGYRRFTPRARNALRYAVDAARDMNHGYVGTEHLLMGLISLGEGVAADVLREVKPLGHWRADLETLAPAATDRVRGRRPFTPLARQAVAHSLEVALRLGHNYIGTEHQLIALAEVPEGIAAKVLEANGLDAAETNSRAVKALMELVAKRNQVG